MMVYEKITLLVAPGVGYDSYDDYDDADADDAQWNLMDSVGYIIVSLAYVLLLYFEPDFAELFSIMLQCICIDATSPPPLPPSTTAHSRRNHQM